MPIRTSALSMFIYCKMAPGLYPADASCQECPPDLPRLSSTEDKQTFASDHTDSMETTASSSNRENGAVGQEQRTCNGNLRHQACHHHRGLDDHLHPVPHVAQADGDCSGKGINSTCVATWLPTRQSRAQGISRVYLPSEDYAICQSIYALA